MGRALFIMQNLDARIAKLRAHIRTRRGRRDFKALQRLDELLNPGEPATHRDVDRMLKHLYTTDALGRMCAEPHPFFAMIKKEKPDVFVEVVIREIDPYRRKP